MRPREFSRKEWIKVQRYLSQQYAAIRAQLFGIKKFYDSDRREPERGGRS